MILTDVTKIRENKTFCLPFHHFLPRSFFSFSRQVGNKFPLIMLLRSKTASTSAFIRFVTSFWTLGKYVVCTSTASGFPQYPTG